MASERATFIQELRDILWAVETLTYGGNHLDPKLHHEATKMLEENMGMGGRVYAEWTPGEWHVEFPNVHLHEQDAHGDWTPKSS